MQLRVPNWGYPFSFKKEFSTGYLRDVQIPSILAWNLSSDGTHNLNYLDRIAEDIFPYVTTCPQGIDFTVSLNLNKLFLFKEDFLFIDLINKYWNFKLASRKLGTNVLIVTAHWQDTAWVWFVDWIYCWNFFLCGVQYFTSLSYCITYSYMMR